MSGVYIRSRMQMLAVDCEAAPEVLHERGWMKRSIDDCWILKCAGVFIHCLIIHCFTCLKQMPDVLHNECTAANQDNTFRAT